MMGKETTEQYKRVLRIVDALKLKFPWHSVGLRDTFLHPPDFKDIVRFVLAEDAKLKGER